MAGEYLTPAEADKVKLPLWPPARLRKIREYAGQIASDLPEDSPLRRIRTRTALVIAAGGRLVRDATIGPADVLREANRFYATGVPDVEAQPELPLQFEQLGEE